ncbi:hypothetical protein AB2P04_05785, partial [Acinetobacter nosocomialis]
MASLLSAVRTRFFDKSNKPLAGGKVYTYEANSTNPKVTWSDEALTVQNTNPVLLDNEGTALIFFSGKYRFRIEDRYGVLVEDNPSVTSLVGIDGVTTEIVRDGDENQKDINDKTAQVVPTISDLLNVAVRKNQQTVYVQSYNAPIFAELYPYKGGDNFTYVDSLKDQYNGVTIFNGWLRDLT